jgi:hypothetical protein
VLDRRPTLLLAAFASLLVACAQPDERGPSTNSDDAQTYLQFEDLNTSTCKPPLVDGRPWPYAVHVPGFIDPGTHIVECGALRFKFRVRPGKTFHFKNWEP